MAKLNELRMTDGKLRTCCGEMLINGVCHVAHSPAHLHTTEVSIYPHLSLELLPERYEWRRRPSLRASLNHEYSATKLIATRRGE